MKQVLIANLPQLQDKITILPRQVRKSPFQRPARLGPGLHLGYSGRIVREKGLHVALTALKFLAPDSEIRFSIAGVIENEPYWGACLRLIADIKRTRPSIEVKYLGFLPYKETDDLYGQIDVLIVPSIWGEPLGAVAAEALSHKAAVIASDVGGLSTFVRHEQTGLLVEPNNPRALASAIERLAANNDLFRVLTAEGQFLIHNEFTMKRHFREFTRLIASVSDPSASGFSHRDTPGA